jgi:hypothetical protein
MDASQRWETEALRTGSPYRKNPPRPSPKQQTDEAAADTPDSDANWVTLREAESATGIPVNTLRKWSRKSAIPSFLESDGELSLRMVDVDAVIAHAHALGRETGPTLEDDSDQPDDSVESSSVDDPVSPPEGTLIVPLDAWNKMLNQLGNLHEAGQQLAEARERAAKAETEATFLRERLAEVRAQTAEGSQFTVHSSQSESAEEPGDDAGGSAKPTTSYWRYLTFGWRDRKKRSSNNP